ncbi:histone acetylation protein-domain-containing protein [Phyllosticta citrichinensis]|uniref:histone acetyltransferase n=1 Tax=Phyllosticta citrichinensis TaxID=1130410 RepID=A0ABR1XYM9_9PEZI
MASRAHAGDASLGDILAEILPQDANFTFYHISTPPTKCAAIFAPPPGARVERTYCESHYLNVSVQPQDDGHPGEVLVFAIEILIYTTAHLTTLFVSKADSTGYLTLLNLPRSADSPIRTISTTFIRWLVKNRQRPGKRLVVSLFARAQDQYLFPGSVDNPTKHVADDTALVKWWCKVLDPVLREHDPESGPGGASANGTTAHGYLIIPGLERNETQRFFPATVKSDPAEQKRWTHGHPLLQITRHPNAPPRCIIPHFPDDPKARYMDELDDELPDGGSQLILSPRGNGQWKSVRSLDQFWDMMSFRQECSSGRLVGFIWINLTPPDLEETVEDEELSSQMGSISEVLAPKVDERKESTRAPKKKKLTGPIMPRTPRIKQRTSKSKRIAKDEVTKYYAWPVSSRGELVLDEKAYKRGTELLQRQNFSNYEAASSSTSLWINEAKLLGGVSSWGLPVVGKKSRPNADSPTNGTGVNVLNASAVRKKRKIEEDTPAPQSNCDDVQTLSTNLIRKNPKAEGAVASTDTSSEVNVLGSNLVRKKPKA